MFDWLSDIFGSAFDTLGQQMSSAIWDTMLGWLYTAIYDAIAQFFTQMGNMGVEIFDLAWVEATLRLFYLFGWALFGVGMVTAIFDVAIESQTGRVSVKTAALNILKGFLAASLVTVVPLELYRFCITLQNTFAGDLTRVFAGQQSLGLGEAGMAALEGSFAVAAEVSASVFNILAMVG